MKKISLIGLTTLIFLSLTACKSNKNNNGNNDPEYEAATLDGYGWFYTNELENETAINVAIADFDGHITNHNDVAFVGLDGLTYEKGDLLPSWKYIEKRLNMKFNDTSSGTVFSNYDMHLEEEFKNADIITGWEDYIAMDGYDGKFINLLGEDENGRKYIDIENPKYAYMPNLSEFFRRNPIIYKTYFSHEDEELHMAPRYESFDRPNLFFHFNVDMVKNILDEELTNANEAKINTPTYTEFNSYSTDARVSITVGIKANAVAKTITKKNSSKNAMTEIKKAGTGKEMVENLRAHLNAVYDGLVGPGKIYENLSDIYISESASYDTDELVALMYCIKNNQGLAQGVSEELATDIDLFICRENKPNLLSLYSNNVFQGLGIMYGVRGALSSECNDAIYLDKNGIIQDGRVTEEFIELFDYSSKLYADGIIPSDYASLTKPIDKIKTNQAFMIYDSSRYASSNEVTNNSTIDFEPVLPPVFNWDDGDVSTDYFHFSSSNNTKALGYSWAIPSRVAEDKEKLKAALTLMDYFYTVEGSLLMNYGPNADQVKEYGGINLNAYCSNTKSVDDSGFYGCAIEHYTFSDAALNAMNASGVESESNKKPQNVFEYATWSKQEMGSNLIIGFSKESFLYYELLSTAGKTGKDKLISAYAYAKTYKTLSLNSANPYFKSVPDFFPYPVSYSYVEDKSTIEETFSTHSSRNKNAYYIMYGWGDEANNTMTKEAYRELITNEYITPTIGALKLYSNHYDSIKC